MTQFLNDVLRQPFELQTALHRLDGADRRVIDLAAAAIRNARHVYLTGMGASWHASFGAGSLLSSSGFPVYMQDTAELLLFSQIPLGSVIVALSRSGRSVEIVRLLDKAKEAGATVIGITNFEDGQLAQRADIPIVLPVKADHGISVNTYSVLALAVAVLASRVQKDFSSNLAQRLSRSIEDTEKRFSTWQDQLAETPWLSQGAAYYFIGRGPSLGSAYEAALLWEEGAKTPASAMSTASFRHGPQEVVTPMTRLGLWVDAEQMRAQDFAVTRDLSSLNALVMLVGQGLPRNAASLVLELPSIPAGWQFLLDVIPAQFAAERAASLFGADCDSFRFASYIVEDDYSLIAGGSHKS